MCHKCQCVKPTFRPFGYERVYLPLCEVADTPVLIQGDDLPLKYVYLYPCRYGKNICRIRPFYMSLYVLKMLDCYL